MPPKADSHAPSPGQEPQASRLSASVTGCILLAALFAALWRRAVDLLSPSTEETFAGSDLAESVADASVDLATSSLLGAVELSCLGALAVVRLLLLWSRRQRAFAPLIDLPALGFLFAVTGGSLSPIDGAVTLLYLAGWIIAGPEEVEQSRGRWLTELCAVLAGLVLVHGIVVAHDRSRLRSSEHEQQRIIRQWTDEVAGLYDLNVQQLQTILNDHPDPTTLRERMNAEDPRAAETLELYLSLKRPIEEAAIELSRWIPRLRGTELDPLLDQYLVGLDEVDLEQYFELRSKWSQIGAARLFDTDPAESLHNIYETLQNIRREILGDLSLLDHVLQDKQRRAARLGSFLRESAVRRAILGAAMLLFALVVRALRNRLKDKERAAQRAKDEQQIELSEQEKDHWIALTAGLTHGFGNDILAYDVYLKEILEELGGKASDRAVTLLKFVRDSNKGRLQFLQFLDAFAWHRKAQAGQPSPLKLGEVDLVEVLREARERVAVVETADLPPPGSDPRVDRQIRKFRDLPLLIRTESTQAGRVQLGHRGVLDFACYELLKNALRNTSGTLPLEAHLERGKGEIILDLDNEVEVEETHGRCMRCKAAGRGVFVIPRRRESPPVCRECLAPTIESLLPKAFEPNKGGGTGLGLFLIRYFLCTFYGGQLSARVSDPLVPKVRFTLRLPDPPYLIQARQQST